MCGAQLCYSLQSEQRCCVLCGAVAVTTASCPDGHFVCDACHGSSGADVIERVCLRSAITDPLALATDLMRSSAIAMHGPEHHFLVPAVLLTAYDNALGHQERKRRDLREVRSRAERVPGGFCGSHGNCGAAVGSGIFWSVVTGTRPISTTRWSESNRLTALALLRIAEHGGPRCCKRDVWHAILEVMAELGPRFPELGWAAAPRPPVCQHSTRNKQCLGEACTFHAESEASTPQ